MESVWNSRNLSRQLVGISIRLRWAIIDLIGVWSLRLVDGAGWRASPWFALEESLPIRHTSAISAPPIKVIFASRWEFAGNLLGGFKFGDLRSLPADYQERVLCAGCGYVEEAAFDGLAFGWE